LYPIAQSAQWLGPFLTYNSTYKGVTGYVDYYFICRIKYQKTANNKAKFEVVLNFELSPGVSRFGSVKKTGTSTLLDVIFYSQDIDEGFRTRVWVTFMTLKLMVKNWLIIYLCQNSQTVRPDIGSLLHKGKKFSCAILFAGFMFTKP